MRSLARKKGALKRFLLAMETPSPTLYRMYRVPHITNAAFPLIVPSSPFALSPSFVFLVLFLSRRFSRFFVLVSPPASRPSPRTPDRIHRKGQPLPRFRHPRVRGATRTEMIREERRRQRGKGKRRKRRGESEPVLILMTPLPTRSHERGANNMYALGF